MAGPNQVTSGAATLSGLLGRECQLIAIDELGDLLSGLKNPRDPRVDIPRVLKSLFSSTDRSEKKAYADTKNNIILPWHHLSVYGTGASERFWESLTFGDITDGFMARVLILESDHEPPFPVKPKYLHPQLNLTQQIKALYHLNPPRQGGGNIAPPAPVQIDKTPDASAWFDSWALDWFKKRNANRKAQDGRAAIYGRAAEHAHKLALVHAVSRTGANIWQESVTLEDVQWAAAFVDYVVPNMVEQIVGNITVNDVDKWRHKVLRVIELRATNKRPGATKREILKGVRGLIGRDFDNVIKAMEDAGDIIQTLHKPQRGREALLYALRVQD